jgi:hypothetical protein
LRANVLIVHHLVVLGEGACKSLRTLLQRTYGERRFTHTLRYSA